MKGSHSCSVGSRLILFPSDPLQHVALDPLQQHLHVERVISGPLPEQHSPYGFLVGERFFDLFLFLGCSPSIELAPAKQNRDAPFCYIQIESEERCRVVAGNNLKAACPDCKGRYQLDAVLHAPEGESGMPQISCRECGANTSADNIVWRKTAAPSKTRISLWNIFEGEAVPSDALLGTLEQQTGIAWSYSYVSGG